MKKTNYTPANRYSDLSVGETVRITRELQGLTQAELAKRAGLSQPILSAIENDRLSLGVERAKRLALALLVHPAVLLFANWDVQKKSA